MGSMLVRVIAGLCMAGMAATAFAQQATSTNRVATKTDWSVFVEEDPTECWSVSEPKETVNTRSGRVVSVRRSEISLIVIYRPDAGVKGQVAFAGGYKFAPGSIVNLVIDGGEFELYPDGNCSSLEQAPKNPQLCEWAWPAKVSDDVRIVTAMKRGTEAVLTARSERGTQTKDTFSLLGFTAAIEDAEKRCSQ